MKNNELDCIAGRLFKNAAKAGGFTLNAKEISWARTQDALSSNPHSIFLATGRNEFTEGSFNWFFRVYTDDVFIFTLDGRRVSSDADVRALKRIGVRRGSPFGAYLEKRGAQRSIVDTVDWVGAAKMLNKGNLDAMCLTGVIGRQNILEIEGVNPSRLRTYKVGEMGWWIITASDKGNTPEIQSLINWYAAERSAKGKVNREELEAFRNLLAVEKSKPYFQALLAQYGVRD